MSKDTRAGVSDGCCMAPRGRGSAVGARAGSQHEDAAGLVLPTGRRTGLESQSHLWEQSQSLSFLILYLVFDIP